MPRVLEAMMGLAVRRPRGVAAAVLVLAVIGAALALGLQPSAQTSTVVGTSTEGYAATQRLYERFGDDPVYVLVREPVTRIVLTEDLGSVLGLEGCLAGNVPRGATPYGGRNSPCGRLAATKPARVVFGPGTFLNTSVDAISGQLTLALDRLDRTKRQAGFAAQKLAVAAGRPAAEVKAIRQQAEQLAEQKAAGPLISLAFKYGITSAPQLDSPQFMRALVFDNNRPAGTPKSRLASIFPGPNAALIQVRLRDSLSEAERRTALQDIAAAIKMPRFRLSGGDYAVTGAPAVVDELADTLGRALIVLLLVAAFVMALTLLIVFRSRRPLLPLLIGLCAASMTFGAMRVLGVPMTMASIAVIPVLIGLAVDYTIQLLSRLQEAGGVDQATVAKVARDGAPTIVTAAAATAGGFLVLALSPVPMVRGFGLLLVAGIVLAVGCALTLGVAGAAWEAPVRASGSRRAGLRARLRSAATATATAWHGAGEIVSGSRAWQRLSGFGRRVGEGALRAALDRPARILGIAAAVAVLGWAIDTQTRVESDVQRLVPASLSTLQTLQQLQAESGVGGEVDVLVEGRRVTDPQVVRWMTDYQARVLKRLKFDRRQGCGRSLICPAFSLPDLFTSKRSLSSRKRVEALLDAVPAYFSKTVIAPDRRAATLAFGVRLMPLDQQSDVLRVMRAELNPPPGVRARLAGLTVLAAEGNARLSSPWRRALTLLAGILAVALVLLIAFRDLRRVLVPLIPIVLASGWASLLLFLTRIPLNPMSVVLGALVVAIATEFGVLLSERFRTERLAGGDVEDALRRTYRSTGTAVRASGVTAIAGFAVLIVSDIRMLRDFGVVTVIDLSVALAGVLLVLPSVLVLAERRAQTAAAGAPSDHLAAAEPALR